MTNSRIISFGDLKEGDLVQGTDGIVEVTKGYDEHIPESSYEIELDDGRTLIASGNHLMYVVTETDSRTHRVRMKQVSKLFKSLDSDIVVGLEHIAASEKSEISLQEFIDFLGVTEPQWVSCIYRIALSVGHIAENTKQIRSLEDGSIVSRNVTKTYDVRQLARQVLCMGSKKYRKLYKPVVGRVITVEDMLKINEPMDIPTGKR